MANTEIDLTVSERLQEVRSLIPAGVELVAVSKFQPVKAVRAAYDAGQRIFGESRVQELLDKIPLLPEDIKWHFIGHPQTNKVKYLVGKTALVESVDSRKLAELINLESEKAGVKTRVLLQVHVAAEETKFGFHPQELLQFFEDGLHEKLQNIEICGLMAMATNTEDEEVVKKDFTAAASLFRKIKNEFLPESGKFNILSMGMSGDWPLAVEEGANMIRIGTAIFGSRY